MLFRRRARFVFWSLSVPCSSIRRGPQRWREDALPARKAKAHPRSAFVRPLLKLLVQRHWHEIPFTFLSNVCGADVSLRSGHGHPDLRRSAIPHCVHRPDICSSPTVVAFGPARHYQNLERIRVLEVNAKFEATTDLQLVIACDESSDSRLVTGSYCPSLCVR